MREDWVFVDFVRAFVPRWPSKAMSLKVFSVVVLALLMIVVALKVESSIV